MKSLFIWAYLLASQVPRDIVCAERWIEGLYRNIRVLSHLRRTTARPQLKVVAIAYAAHKAASPIRFPPTVLLTPVVAKLIGKEPNEMEEEGA